MKKIAVLLLILSSNAFAQQWPQRPVKVVVPFPPGGVTDSIARITADWLAPRLGQPVIAENRPGASGAIAADFVARSEPDGYTLFSAATPQLAVVPHVQKIAYDPVKDFAPISIVGTNPFALGCNEKMPASNLGEFVAYVKERQGQLSFASPGSGSVGHLTMALFLARAGLKMEAVLYKGGGPAIADVVAGHVPCYFGNLNEIIPHAGSGRLKVFAVSSERRAPQLPQVPLISALRQVFGQGQLRRRRGGQGGRQLVACDCLLISAGDRPAYAISGRQALRKGGTMHDQPLGVECLGRNRPLAAEIQLAVHVVLDQRHIVPRQQLHQVALVLVRHQAAQRILEIRHQPACLRLMLDQGRLQCSQIDSFARMGRYLYCAQSDALERLQGTVERRRFNDHGVPRPGRCHQAQIQCFQRAVGDDDVVGMDLKPVRQVAQRNLAPQAGIAGRHIIYRAPWIHALHANCHRARQAWQRKQQRARKCRSERHHVAGSG